MRHHPEKTILDLLLIDANNIGYASMYTPALSALSHEGRPTGGILGVVQSAIRLIQRFPGYVPILLWDGEAAWRKTLCPEYKENRKDPQKQAVADSWGRQRAMAGQLFLHLGIPQVRSSENEADDLAGFLARAAGQADSGIGSVIMVSGDTDWWQAISERASWFSPITDKAVTLANLQSDAVKDGPFLGPAEYLEAKIIAGDSSDNIPGVPGVGLKTACKLLRQHGGVEGIANAVAGGLAKDKKSQSIVAYRPQIERNRQIMDWSLAPPVPDHALGILRQPFDWREFSAIASSLGLQRLLDRLAGGSAWEQWENSVRWEMVLDAAAGAILGFPACQ